MSGVRIDTARLDHLIAVMPERCAKVVAKGASAVEASAKTFAPVDTGALKSSIHDQANNPYLHWVSPGVEYAIYQELGTSRMAAHPFLLPAAERVRPQYIRMWSTLFKG